VGEAGNMLILWQLPPYPNPPPLGGGDLLVLLQLPLGALFNFLLLKKCLDILYMMMYMSVQTTMRSHMKTVSFTEFRKNASNYFFSR